MNSLFLLLLALLLALPASAAFFDLPGDRPVSLESMAAKLTQRQVVLVGERHGEAAHHRLFSFFRPYLLG